MREIGGYIEFEKYNGNMLHEDGIKLNLGRNAFAYLVEAKGIKNILFPKYMCDSLDLIIKKYQLNVSYYSIGMDFKPKNIIRNDNEYLYIVNYFGQLSDDYILSLGDKVIVDNVQAYFTKPLNSVDTIYSCRKFFGVSDGAILYTDGVLNREIPIDKSFNRMHYLLGRFENNASEYYPEYVNNNKIFKNEPLKQMSKLTYNILHSINYERIETIRTNNFYYLHGKLSSYNKLDLIVPDGAFMYPLYIDKAQVLRKELLENKIYIPKFWPNVLEQRDKSELEYQLTENILLLPIDQRYSIDDLKYTISFVSKYL